jgi:hypothetical protein
MRRACGLLGLLLLAGAGCGSNRSAEVAGTVRFKDRPLASGSVTFVDAEGKRAHSPIAPDGRYTVRGLATGPAQVCVSSHPPVPAGLLRPEEQRGHAATAVAIPARYARPETSGLEVQVRRGRQERDLDLTP